MSCGIGHKICNGACVAIDDPTYGCDSSACDPSACPAASGATLVCQGLSCVLGTCPSGTKKCGTTCVSVSDPAYGCGANTCDATTCPAVGTGAVVCQGTACVVGTCGAGTKKCNNKCVSLTDPTYGCGATSCDATTCPTVGTGTLVCQGTACVAGTCGPDTKKCGNKCVPTDANNGCGDAARCTACANNETCVGTPLTSCQCIPNNNAACANKACGPATNNCGQTITCTNTCLAPNTCNGGTAGVNGCGCAPIAMATACNNKCGPVPNGCGTNYTCTCPTGQVCGGVAAGACCTPTPMATACSNKCGPVSNGCGGSYNCTCPGNTVCGGIAEGACCTPLTTLAACNGKACGPTSDGCGQTLTCPNTCTATPNTTVTCAANQCVRGCASGATPLACSTATNPACGRWDFESSTTEGWTSSDPLGASTSTLHASSGSRSLKVPVPPSDNVSVALEVRFCPTSAVTVAGKRLTAHFFFASDTGAPVTAADGLFASIDVTDHASGFLRVASLEPVNASDIVIQGTIPSNYATAVTHLSLSFISDSTDWSGDVYVDDVRIE